MAEAEAKSDEAPRVAIRAQYVRDASFENVAVQKGDGRMDQKPEIQVGVNLDARKRDGEQYEVVLKINATAKHEAAVMFIAELDYAGLFEIANVPEAQLHPFLLIECPRMLFPFARRIIADFTRDGGYPPLMLDMIDFASLYRNELERRRAAATAAQNGSAGGSA
ncbi:MAG: protein-export chaperone SecB [Pikeienuella sp.]